MFERSEPFNRISGLITSKERHSKNPAVMEFNSALKPLRIVSQVMGLNVEGRLGRVYTLLVFITLTLLLYASFVHLSNENTEVLTGIDSLILWTQFGTNTLFIYVVLGSCLIKPGQFLFPIREMRHVDNLFRSFGTKITDEYLRRTRSLHIFVLLVIPNLLGAKHIYDTIWGRSFLPFCHWLYYGYALTLSMITDCLFVDYLAVINRRSFELNQLMGLLVRRNFKPSSSELAMLYVLERDGIWKQNNRTLASVDKLRLIYHHLCSISKKVTASFGLLQLVSTTISLIMTTGQLYEAYHFIIAGVNPTQIVLTKILWIMCYIGRTFYISYACSRTSHEASLTSSIIHEMPMQYLSNSVSVQMQHFSLQLLHENLNFNACGFFEIDFKLLCSIVGVVTTYLVILIQIDRKTQCTNSVGLMRFLPKTHFNRV